MIGVTATVEVVEPFAVPRSQARLSASSDQSSIRVLDTRRIKSVSVESSSASNPPRSAPPGVLRPIGGFKSFGAVVGEIDRHDPTVIGFTPSVDESVALERVDRLEIAARLRPASRAISWDSIGPPTHNRNITRNPANDQPAGLWIVDSRSLNIRPPSRKMPNIALNVSGSTRARQSARRRCPRPRGRECDAHSSRGRSFVRDALCLAVKDRNDTLGTRHHHAVHPGSALMVGLGRLGDQPIANPCRCEPLDRGVRRQVGAPSGIGRKRHRRIGGANTTPP